MSVLHQNKWRQEKEKYVLEFHLRKKKARHFEGKPSCFCCSSVIVSKLFFLLIFFSCIGENNYKTRVSRAHTGLPAVDSFRTQKKVVAVLISLRGKSECKSSFFFYYFRGLRPLFLSFVY